MPLCPSYYMLEHSLCSFPSCFVFFKFSIHKLNIFCVAFFLACLLFPGLQTVSTFWQLSGNDSSYIQESQSTQMGFYMKWFSSVNCLLEWWLEINMVNHEHRESLWFFLGAWRWWISYHGVTNNHQVVPKNFYEKRHVRFDYLQLLPKSP